MSTSTLPATRRHTVTQTLLGEITIVASGDVIEGLYFQETLTFLVHTSEAGVALRPAAPSA